MAGCIYEMLRVAALPRAHVGGQDERTLGARIAHGAQHGSLFEARRPELIEESVRFPGAGDSGKPVGFRPRMAERQRTSQHELRRVDHAILL